MCWRVARGVKLGGRCAVGVPTHLIVADARGRAAPAAGGGSPCAVSAGPLGCGGGCGCGAGGSLVAEGRQKGQERGQMGAGRRGGVGRACARPPCGAPAAAAAAAAGAAAAAAQLQGQGCTQHELGLQQVRRRGGSPGGTHGIVAVAGRRVSHAHLDRRCSWLRGGAGHAAGPGACVTPTPPCGCCWGGACACAAGLLGVPATQWRRNEGPHSRRSHGCHVAVILPRSAWGTLPTGAWPGSQQGPLGFCHPPCARGSPRLAPMINQ
jgi:hypothetical protein